MDVMFWLIVAAMCAAAGAAVSRDGDKVPGAVLGALLGPLGVIAAAIAFREKSS